MNPEAKPRFPRSRLHGNPDRLGPGAMTSALTEVVLLHEGELSDVAGLLDELGASWVEGRAAQLITGTPGVVIGTPQHLLRWHGDNDGVARVAVCDGGGRTLAKKLELEGIDFIVRRPIHPAALRLLILHLIYRGPERRRLRRVSAGLPVKYRMGLWPRPGLLLEFSVGGCQMLCDSELPAGQNLRMTLPAELGLGRKLKIQGRVVRSKPAEEGAEGEFVSAIDFGDLAPDVRQRLAAGVVARARQVPTPKPQPAIAKTEPISLEPEPQAAEEPGERREHARGTYTKAVHGRVGDVHVVLMGSNLSCAGMQVDRDPNLAIGQRLKLDLYGHGDIPPLRIEAHVARDDGERGFFLEFQSLWPGAPALLERLIKTLPVLTPSQDEAMVISEVVERH